MTDTVHVTGGTGFIGSALSRRLVEEGYDVKVFDNNSRDSGHEIPDAVDFTEGSVLDRPSFDRWLKGADVLVHLAAVNGTKNFYDHPMDVLDVNVGGTRNAVKLAGWHDLDRLVFTSSSEVYGFPDTFPTPESHPLQIMDVTNDRYSYAGSKIIGEQYVRQGQRQHDYDYTILRPHNFYGPAMGHDHVIPEFVEQLVTDQDFTIYGDGEQTRSFCFISDAIDCFLAALERDVSRNQTYNVGTEQEITINELADALCAVHGDRPEIEHVDHKELDGSPDRRQPNIQKARHELDYRPSVSLRQGLEATYSWYAECYA